MARRLILDTGVLIRSERGMLDLSAFLNGDDDVALAAVTVAELQMGVELADETRRERRQEVIDSVLALIPVEDYTADTARVHARLLAHARRVGKPRGAHDLLIAATAAATARTVVTTDGAASFGELPGVRCLSL
ncbi:PIN domain-containing protein [Streptomyces verrucosisporus]|uniref:PIN domain-containing protein n=1 Tax=Streptomyces verrucosisporus TaxID=1695161 RepID=UPI0027DA4345|nr:PIN domain-containing protein [Streptomyces verrucosisporus]MBN3930387.1 PIN domain-containing protein [Streptomyces verrucosisporus]